SSKIIFVLLVSWGKLKESLFKQRLPQAPKHGYNFFTLTYMVPCGWKVLMEGNMLVQRGLHALVRTVRTDKDTEFLNKTLHAYFASEGINHQTFVARIPEQNSVVERWNRTLVKAARTMLSAAKVPLFFWAEAIATTCFTQNRSLMASDHVSFDPVQQCQRMALELDILSPGPQSQENVPHAAGIVTTSNELDLLFM
nr:putative ribonuclease H-like domain-containing protein [Tanacetum cinerariifolium]